MDRLDQVIVRAALEPGDQARNAVSGGENENRKLVERETLPYLPAKIDPFFLEFLRLPGRGFSVDIPFFFCSVMYRTCKICKVPANLIEIGSHMPVECSYDIKKIKVRLFGMLIDA